MFIVEGSDKVLDKSLFHSKFSLRLIQTQCLRITALAGYFGSRMEVS